MSIQRYPRYKETHLEWLSEVPEHWLVTRLKHSCRVFPSNVDKKSHEGETPVALCNYTDVYYNDRITPTLEFMAATASVEQIAKFTLKAGDTIITKDSETADDIAVSAYVPEDLPGVVCGYHLAMVRPLPHVFGPFVKRLFDSVYAKSRFATLANGLTRVGLGQHELDNVMLPFPPKDEQTQISQFLERETAKIDALVEEQRQLIQLLKEKRQAVISHGVTKGLNRHAKMKPSGIEWVDDVPEHWTIERLKYLITKIEQGWSPQCDNEPAGDGEWGVLKVGCGNREEFDPTEQKALPFDLAPLPDYEIKPGDILMSRGNTRDLVGMATLVKAVRPKLLLCDLLYRFHARNQRASAEFLVLALRSAYVRFQIEREATGTSASMKKISQGTIKNFVICVPPLREQIEIVAGINSETAALDALTDQAARGIALLHERRTALISAAVTGTIDVREPKADAVSEKRFQSGFARQLLAAEILVFCHAHQSTGRVKLQKLIHLCEYVAELDEVAGAYRREAAGPFDNQVMFGVTAGLKKQKWFSEIKHGTRTSYQPLEKSGEHKKYLARWSAKMPKVQRILELLGHADTQQCEIVSTLYAAWNDLLLEGKSPTDAQIISEASHPTRWHESKAKISPEKWPAAIKWMREKGLTPTGFGAHTKRAVAKK